MNKAAKIMNSLSVSNKTLIQLIMNSIKISSVLGIIMLFSIIFVLNSLKVSAQDYSQPYNYSGNFQANNYMANSSAFKQEIARLEINVVRQGKGQLPISQVPRLQKDDILKVRLLDEAVNGIKPDQSNWQWTLSIAYVNPALNGDFDKSVSEEIQFKKTGWYKEYSFVVPYDNQPIFFLYPKPNYRDKVLNLINKNKDEIRKIGEKTIEIANAYAKVGSFLNELQWVLNRSQYGYGYGNVYGTTTTGQYGSYDPYSTYSTTPTSSFNKSLFMEQSIERLARSFNIQMPSCWQGGSYGGSSYGGYNNYSYGSSPYNTGTYNNYGTGYTGNLMGNDLVSRAQCLAKSVRLEDLDFSISKMLQQGGILLVQQLSQQYPQIAHWINIAAVAIDFILKLTQKTPLKIVPTVITASMGQDSVSNATSPYSSSTSPYSSSFAPPVTNNVSGSPVFQPGIQSRISLFAEVSPMNDGFVTAYPIVVHKWQANPDPEVIKLPTPVLIDSCLHIGSNILGSTDVINDWMSDSFTKDFQLAISSPNGFSKVLPLKKNVGFNGWELILSKEDIDSFPKINMPFKAVVVGKRGFNEITSPIFALPSPASGSWEVTAKSKNLFAVGGRRTVTIQNSMNNCKCLQAVVYKPSFGGQFVFEAGNKENSLRFSDDAKEVSFDIDATMFQSGDGQLELKQYGGEISVLELKLHPGLPTISEFKVSKGDKRFTIVGNGLEQIRALIINGERAILDTNPSKATSEKEFIFENPNTQILSNNVSLEIELQENRIYQYPTKFDVSLSRPLIVSNKSKEVKGVVVTNSKGVYKNIAPQKTKSSNSANSKVKPAPVSEKLPDFPLGGSEITVNLNNALTDYDFKAENIEIETRIEDFPNQSFEVELPKANFQVIDWKHIQVSFLITKPFKDVLGEKNLQFRIRDKERGNSDWFTVRNNSSNNEESDTIRFSRKSNGNNQSNTETSKPAEQLQDSDSNNPIKPVEKESDLILPTSTTNKVETMTKVAEEKSTISPMLPNQTVAQIYTSTALEYYIKKDYKNAYEWFNKAVVTDPKNALYRYNLGSILTALMDFSAAEKEMLEATKLDPENQTYKIGLDIVRQNSKNFQSQY